MMASCTTIHFRSKNLIPVTFEGNSSHQKEATVTGRRDFYFWGIEPAEHEVFVDEEIMKAGYDGMSKVIIYEQKNPEDMLISFLTFGLYLPRGFTITGFTSSGVAVDDDESEKLPIKRK